MKNVNEVNGKRREKSTPVISESGFMGRLGEAIAKYKEARVLSMLARELQNAPGPNEVLDTIRFNTPFFKDVIARAYQQKGNIDRTIAEYEKLITFDPNSRARFLVHPELHFRLAKLYEQKGWKEKAIGQYQKFLGLCEGADPGIPEVEEAKKRLGAF